MRTASSFAIALGVCLLSQPGLAQRRDDETAVSYTGAIGRGHRAAAARDFGGALAAYREAATLQGDKGEPHYYIASVLFLQGDTAGATAAFQTAAQKAAAAEPEIRAKALMNLSFLLEAGELPPARDSWNEYVRFCDSHQQVPTHAATGRGRVQAIDKVRDLAQQYVAVRERIAARERENARSRGRGQR